MRPSRLLRPFLSGGESRVGKSFNDYHADNGLSAGLRCGRNQRGIEPDRAPDIVEANDLVSEIASPTVVGHS
jgi:hypothetical protein